MKPFTVVIPLIPQHDSKIRSILAMLRSEQDLIEEVILCRSESVIPKKVLRAKFSFLALQLGFEPQISVNSISTVARDGVNRNRGWADARTEYVAFIDADDFYSPSRLAVLLNAMRSSNADAMIHDYAGHGESIDKINLVNVSEISTFKLSLSANSTNSDLPEISNAAGIPVQAHFAHITVKNDIKTRIQFTAKFPGADWEFVVNLIRNDLNLQFAPLKLSAWNRHRSIRYYLRLIRMKYFTQA